MSQVVSETDPGGRDESLPRAPARYFPGDVIDDRYEVLAHVGAGGAGDVYRVFDRLVEREFALKIYNGTIGGDAAVRELRALMLVEDLRHVVRAFDVSKTATAPPQVYLKTEFIDGVSLAELVAHGPEQDLDQLRSIGDQLLAALQAIHPADDRINEIKAMSESSMEGYRELSRLQESARVHRDVKPGNLMLTDERRLKLLDFNIAMQAGRTVLTRSHSLGYEPPDAEARWTPSFDLFSAGVVLYEVLCGTHPFPDRVTSGVRQPVSDHRPDVGHRFEAFFDRALAPEAAERFVTAGEMRAAFAALFDQSVGAADADDAGDQAAAVAEVLEDRMARVRAVADDAGLAALFDEARAVAARRQLGARPYVRSLMLTPPTDARIVLVNLEFLSDGRVGVFINSVQWEAFYDVGSEELTASLAAPGNHVLDAEQAMELLGRLDRLADRPVVGSRTGTEDAQGIVDLLESQPSVTFTSEQVAEALGISKRRAGKLLSKLVGSGCPKRYQGRVVRVAADEYQALLAS